MGEYIKHQFDIDIVSAGRANRPPSTGPTVESWRDNALEVRLRRPLTSMFATWKTAYVPGTGRVIVFVVTPAGNHVTFEDEEALYPSDTLVAKIKLVLDGHE